MSASTLTHTVRGIQTDGDLAAAVRALNWNLTIPQGEVHVTAGKGWITLRGDAGWQFERQEAEGMVGHLLGVKGVRNLITVKATATLTDLRRTIEGALARNAQVDAERITVEVQGERGRRSDEQHPDTGD